MGVVPHSLKMLQSHIVHVGGFNNCRMLELGDQQMYCHHNIPEASAAKSYFEQLGVQHTSVDLNGELGALPLNLASRIDNLNGENVFDVVTDFGTTEHVGPEVAHLHACRENVHRFCRPGGLMVFMNPKVGNWPLHGYHYFTLQHYSKLAEAMGYRVLEISEFPTLGNSTDGWQIHTALLKNGDAPFLSLEAFTELCLETVFRK